MDVNEYIASGILESYSIGAVSSSEKKEVECMSHIYPEIRTELDKIMLAIEQMADAQKINPPADLKSKIFAQLKNEAPVQKQEAKIVSISGKSNYASFNRLLAAACVVFAVAMVSLYFYQTSVEADLSQKLADANDQLGEQNVQMAQIQEAKKLSDGELAMFRDPDFKTVFLKGVGTKPQNSLAIVCCNPKKNHTVISIEDLPVAPTDKDYQLWALVDGKPVDMGVLPADSLTKGFFDVKNIEGAQAYAITLEKKGGVPSPTLEEMYVMGQVQ